MGYRHIKNLYADQTILMFKECYATEKIHGCLESETVLITKDGPKTIKDICNEQYRGKVLSYSLSSEKPVWKNVTNHWVGDETEDWYEVKISDGKLILATGNHMFWLPELKCWRRASDLKEGDSVEISEKIQ